VTVVQAIKSGALGPTVDVDQVYLWGTSFGGGHVIVAAQRLGTLVKGVVSMVPHMDGKAAVKRNFQARGMTGVLRTVCLAVSDGLRGLVGLPPVYVKIAGLPNEVSFMTLNEADLVDYFSKHPKVYMGGWQNKAPARLVTFVNHKLLQHRTFFTFLIGFTIVINCSTVSYYDTPVRLSLWYCL
jgi:pimeloyl-ACP methyl ester carboxylesterase